MKKYILFFVGVTQIANIMGQQVAAQRFFLTKQKNSYISQLNIPQETGRKTIITQWSDNKISAEECDRGFRCFFRIPYTVSPQLEKIFLKIKKMVFEEAQKKISDKSTRVFKINGDKVTEEEDKK